MTVEPLPRASRRDSDPCPPCRRGTPCRVAALLELLCGAAALGLGDLLEPAGRCAALGLLLPLPERLRPGALWEDGRRLRHPAEAAELAVAEPVLELPLELTITPVQTETEASAEPALRIPPEDCLAAALYVRRPPERNGPGEATHPRLSGDLELHVPRGALPCADAVLAGVIAEPPEGSPGDPVRGYRITAAALQAWAGTSTAVGEAAALAVRRALGIRAQAGVLDATVLLPPSAVAASRIAAELEALRIQAVPLGSRALLIAGVPDRRTLAAAARAAGFDLQQAQASMLLEVLPDSLLAGEGLDEFEELTVRAARARLEQAMATGRPLRLLLPGRRRPRSVTAEVFELDRLDGLLTVWLRILDGPGAGRREAHHLRDIPGYGPLV